MGKINWGRVVLGGIVAWIVMGVFNAILIPMLAETMQAALETMGGSSDMSDATVIVSGTLISLVGAFVAVWLYAAIRPRYGPGPVTAAIAGFVVWLILSVGLSSFVLLTNLTLRAFAVLHGPALVTWVVSTVAGAAVYKEDGAQAPAAASEAEPGQ